MAVRHPSAVLLTLAWSLVAASAAADEKQVCIEAVERAQVVRLDGKLLEARSGFATCARPVCPAAVRRDCARWFGEVDASVPTVLFEPRWPDGHDARGGTVRIDGSLVVAEPGRAVSLDPGEHAFRFEVPGAAPFETRNVVREGEKERVLRVTLTPLAPVLPATPTSSPTASVTLAATGATKPSETSRSLLDLPAAPDRRAPIPITAYVLGGVALGGLASFAYFGLTGTHRLDDMRSTCGHACNPSDVDGARRMLLVGDILGAVGLVAAGAALWLTLVRPGSSSPPVAR